MSIINPLHTRVSWPFQGGAFFLDPFCHLCFMLVFVMPSSLFHVTLWSPFGMGWPLGSLVCGVFLCVFCFTMWCPGSGVVFGCINSYICSLIDASAFLAVL